jgi:hypothetical protein
VFLGVFFVAKFYRKKLIDVKDVTK